MNIQGPPQCHECLATLAVCNMQLFLLINSIFVSIGQNQRSFVMHITYLGCLLNMWKQTMFTETSSLNIPGH